MEQNEDGMMSMDWVSDGTPERIPPIGARLQIKPHLLFKVEAYGESMEVDFPTSPTGKAYKLKLLGCFVVPAGSPIEVLEDLLGGKL